MTDSPLLTAIGNTDRLATLVTTGLLDAGPDETFDRLTRLASRVLRVPIALVSLVDSHRQYFAGAVGLPEPFATARETPLTHSFCQHTVLSRRPLVVSDARTDPLVSANLAVVDLKVNAYAGVPLLNDDGQVLGTFCALDYEPRSWTDDDLATIADLAAAATTEIRLRRAVAVAQAELGAREAAEALLERTRLIEADERQASERLRQEFLDGVAHDLRNPLAAVKGQAQLLLRQLTKRGAIDPDRLLAGLRGIDASVGQMTAQIAELQDVARLRSGQPLELRKSRADLVTLVHDAVAGVRQTAARHRIILETVEETVSGLWDVMRLRRVLDNLLGNAVKYSPGGGDVRIKVSAEDRGDESWGRIDVRDEGVGIPEADLDRIFERFRRGSNVTGRIRGTGIGLAGARQIIEQHGGSISITSDEGHGTTVTVRLPLAGPDRTIGPLLA